MVTECVRSAGREPVAEGVLVHHQAHDEVEKIADVCLVLRSEIRMLDRDPLSALNQLTRPDEQEAADSAFVAKLRYQQTKIDQAPDTILVDAEVVAIIHAQQQWTDTPLKPRWAAGPSPK